MPLAKTTLPCCEAEVRFRYNYARVSTKATFPPLGTILYYRRRDTQWLRFAAIPLNDARSPRYREQDSQRTKSGRNKSLSPIHFTAFKRNASRYPLVNFCRGSRTVSASGYSANQRNGCSPSWASMLAEVIPLSRRVVVPRLFELEQRARATGDTQVDRNF